MSSNSALIDGLIALKNTVARKSLSVNLRTSRLFEAVLFKLKKSGYISKFEIQNGRVTIFPEYIREGNKIKRAKISGLELISTPSKEVTADHLNLPTVFAGYGIAVLTTNQGVLTNKECQKRKIGGTLICKVW